MYCDAHCLLICGGGLLCELGCWIYDIWYLLILGFVGLNLFLSCLLVFRLLIVASCLFLGLMFVLMCFDLLLCVVVVVFILLIVLVVFV